MKLFIFNALLFASAATDFKTLEEVYGPLPEVEDMAPKTSGYRSRSAARNVYRATRLPDNCIFPLDIVIVQDATDSFSDDYVQMATVQLPTMVSILNETHPGSELALVAFQDKPIVPFGVAPTPENGYYSDHCTFINSALTPNASAIEAVYAMYSPNGGGDPPESQFTALLAATQAEGIQWSGSPDRAQLIVMVTDAPPHFAGDGSDPQGMRPSTGTYDEANPEDQCVTEFYPSPEQVKASIQQRSAYTAFLVYDPEYMEGLVGRSWLWFNRFLNQTDDFITLQAHDSSNFWTNLASIIGVIEDIECLPASTSLPPATDIPPMTSTATAAVTTGPTLTPVGTVEPTGLPTLTSVGTIESTELPVSDSSEGETTECPPCPTGNDVCCHWFRPAVVIKVNDRPERLIVDYEK